MKSFLTSLLYTSLTLTVFISILYPRNSSEEFYEDLTAYQNSICPEVKMLNQPNIKLDDYYGVFSEIDNAFFPAGKTPKYVIISFWGIEIGDKWAAVGSDLGPISGNFILTHYAENIWVYERDELLIRFQFTGIFFMVLATYEIDDVRYSLFKNLESTWEYFAGENEQTVKWFWEFVNGFFEAAWLADVDPVPVTKTAEQFGLNNDKKVFYAGIARNTTTGTYRFSRLSDGTCVKIRVDKSFVPE